MNSKYVLLAALFVAAPTLADTASRFDQVKAFLGDCSEAATTHVDQARVLLGEQMDAARKSELYAELSTNAKATYNAVRNSEQFVCLETNAKAAYDAVRNSELYAKLSTNAKVFADCAVANSTKAIDGLKAAPAIFASWITAEGVTDAKKLAIAARVGTVVVGSIVAGCLLKKLFSRKKAQLPRHTEVE